jgi:hypothetical protein
MLVKSAHALVGGLHISCRDMSLLSKIPAVLVKKVHGLTISLRSVARTKNPSSPLPPVTEPAPLHQPFRNLKSFSWYAPGTDGRFALSVLETNPQLEDLHLSCHGQLHEEIITALTLRAETLTKLSLSGDKLADADLRNIGQHCKNLTTLHLTGNASSSKQITDAGITALAEGCTKIEKVTLSGLCVTGDALAALFTHCVHLKEVSCLNVAINKAAVLALGNPARMAQISEMSCMWGVTTPLSATDCALAFSGLTRLWVNNPARNNAASLHTALREMRRLQNIFLTVWPFRPLPASVLSAIAEGTELLQELRVTGSLSGSAESGLVAIARRNPKLTEVNFDETFLAVTDPVLHALAEHCPGLKSLSLCYAHDVTDVSVMALARGCSALSCLDLRRCFRLTDRSILALAEHAHLLRFLDVRDSHRITQPALEQLLMSTTSMSLDMDVSAASISRAEALRLQRLYREMAPPRYHFITSRRTASMWLADKIRNVVGSACSGCWAAPAVAEYAAVPPV